MSASNPNDAKHRRRRRFGRHALLLATTCLTAAAWTAPATANPLDGKVKAGQAVISGQGTSKVEVRQNSERAVIDWRSFDIDSGETTRFRQPSARSAALNRVRNSDPSHILGNLNANGRVFLVNPNGVFFGPNSRIDVAGLVATTADIANRDFMSGNYNFAKPSDNAAARIVNHGSITVREQGLGALVAPGVENTGVIQAKMGEVVLAGTKTFALDFHGDGLISFHPGQAVDEGENLGPALVSNSGRISADGGRVLMTARTMDGVVDRAVSMDGVVEARKVSEQGGAIVLSGEGDGLVDVTGRLDASAASGQGGRIDVVGERVAIRGGAELDASGASGGGAIHVGGSFQGEGPLPNAERTLVGRDTQLKADAWENGDGGEVVVWADGATRFNGTISARGGAKGGDGGQVETSGKEALQVVEGKVDTRAPKGTAGQWLLDPLFIDVGNFSGVTDPDFDDNFLEFDENEFGTSQVDVTAINGANTNVRLQAELDITFQSGADIDMAQAGVGLVAQAGDHIFVNSSITTNGGVIHLEADSPHSPGQTSTPNDGTGRIDISAATSLTSNGGDITLISGSLGADGPNFAGTINAGAGDISIAPSQDFQDVLIGATNAGDGTNLAIDGNQLVNFTTSGMLSIGRATTAGPNADFAGGTELQADAIDLQPLDVIPGTLDLSGNPGILRFVGEDITISDDILAPDGGFVAQAAGDITVNTDITTFGSTLHLEADSPHVEPNDASTNDGDGRIVVDADATLSSNGGDMVLITGEEQITTDNGPDFSGTFNAGSGDIFIANSQDGEDLDIAANAVQVLTGPGIQIDGNQLPNFTTTGTTTIGTATTAGPDGDFTGGEILTANDLNLFEISSATLDYSGKTGILRFVGENILIADTILGPDGGFVAQASNNIDVEQDVETQGSPIHLEADSPHVTPASGTANDGEGSIDIDNIDGAAPTVQSNGGDIVLISGERVETDEGGIVTETGPNINGLVDAGSGDIMIGPSQNGAAWEVQATNVFDATGGTDGVILFSATQIAQNLLTTGTLTMGEATTAGPRGSFAGGLARRVGSIAFLSGVDFLTDPGAYILSSSGPVTGQAGAPIITNTLGIDAGGAVNVAEGQVANLAIEAPDQTIDFTNTETTLLTITDVDGLSGIDGSSLALTANGSVTFASSLRGGEDGVIISMPGTLIFDAPVGSAGAPIGNLAIGDPTTAFDIDAPSIAALDERGNNVDINDQIFADTVLINVGGAVDAADNLFSASALGIQAGGFVNFLNADVDVLAVSATNQGITFFDTTASALSVGNVGGIDGITYSDLFLSSVGDIGVDAPLTGVGTEAVVSANGSATFNAPVRAPDGDLVVIAGDEVTFNAPVGTATAPLRTVAIGNPTSSFDPAAPEFAELLPSGTDVRINDAFFAGTFFINVNGFISSVADALDVGALTVGGLGSDLFGSVAGVDGEDAALVAEVERFATDPGTGEEAVQDDFLLNGCVIEVGCLVPEEVPEDEIPNDRHTKPDPSKDTEQKQEAMDPTQTPERRDLRQVNILDSVRPPEEGEQILSNTGNEELWNLE